jgi:hypothetical protein
MRLGGPHSQCERYGEEKNILSLQRIELRLILEYMGGNAGVFRLPLVQDKLRNVFTITGQMGENTEICHRESRVRRGGEDEDCIHLDQTMVKYEPSNEPSTYIKRRGIY